MKQSLLLLALAMPFMAHAYTNYFQDGMTWRSETSGTESPEMTMTTVTTSLDGTATIDGVTALQMYETSSDAASRQLIAYVRTDGDLVYFKRIDSDEWLLMYDFGLTPDADCTVSNINFSSTAHMKCTAVNDSDARYNGLATIAVDEYSNDFCNGKGVWIKGIGSTMGVTFNSGYGLDGVYSRLIEATYNGTTVYSASTASAANIISNSITISPIGRELYIRNATANTLIAVYSIDGKQLCNLTATGSDIHVTLPHAGFYIIKHGTSATRISVR
jgi:hypothetical protein